MARLIVQDGMSVEEFIAHVEGVHGWGPQVPQISWNASRAYHKHVHDTSPQDHEHVFVEKMAR